MNVEANNNGSNKNLLIIIAVFSAVSASVLMLALGAWVFNTWRTNQIINNSVAAVSSTPDLEGAWEGVTEYVDGTPSSIVAELHNSDPIEGSFTFLHDGSSCKVDVFETSRNFGTIYVDTRSTYQSDDDCATSGEWQLNSAGNTLTGTLTWSSIPELEGMTLSIHKN
ncbi:hypothetical protein [Rhodococcus sp. NPDC006774]|uniref:hypothetical protein n=1 Tax=Rhodococcus sp. NPDC006774 TaxID=3157186 RepID=UPI0033EAE36F